MSVLCAVLFVFDVSSDEDVHILCVNGLYWGSVRAVEWPCFKDLLTWLIACSHCSILFVILVIFQFCLLGGALVLVTLF